MSAEAHKRRLAAERQARRRQRIAAGLRAVPCRIEVALGIAITAIEVHDVDAEETLVAAGLLREIDRDHADLVDEAARLLVAELSRHA